MHVPSVTGSLLAGGYYRAPVSAIMGRMGRLRVRGVVLSVAVLGFMLAWPSPGGAAGFAVRHRADLLPGVEVRGLRGSALSVDVGRVARGAPVRVEVAAAGAVAGGVETTSAVCRRVGGILCVNGDFAECRACTTAMGGIVHDGVLQRSPLASHAQLSLGPAGPAAGPLGWGATLEATLAYPLPAPPVPSPTELLGNLLQSPATAPPPTERIETVSLALDAVNRGRGPNQVVLYTPPWGTGTRTNGGEEAVLGGGPASVGTNVPVTRRPGGGNGGNTPIPGDGMVLSADGAASSRVQAFWAKAADTAAVRRSVVLRPTLSRPTEESVGGHPRILEDGRTLFGGSEPFATGRHPRTLVGWNSAGDFLLVTVDGRQSGSTGVSLAEAADVLRQVGATSGFNLDGGGSSTFVSLAQGGGRTPRVLNRPSDGNERRVATVLAVVPADGAAVRTSAAPPAPPPPPPAPPGPPPVDEASVDGLPAQPGSTLVPTIAPTATAAPSTSLPAPMPPTEPPEAVAFESAAPPPPPGRAGRPSTGVPAAAAAVALAAAAAAARRARRRRGSPTRDSGPPGG